jgi:hypothetical protein
MYCEYLNEVFYMRGEKKARRGSTPDQPNVECSKRGSTMNVREILDEQAEKLRKLREDLKKKTKEPIEEEKPKKKPRKKKKE